MRRAAEVMRTQGTRLRETKAERDHWQDLTLVSQRTARDVAMSWLESVEMEEEVDIEALREMANSLADAVAYLEEHF